MSEDAILQPAPAESARFGLRVARAEGDRLDADALLAALKHDRVDVAILRVPAPALELLDALRRLELAVIVADTIVHYGVDLPVAGMEADASIVLRDAGPADAVLLASTTRETFAGYTSHYNANPLFAPQKVLDGYAEWAASHVEDARDGEGAWLVEADGELAAFSCYREDASTGTAVGVLNGVLPAMRGRGVYRRMLREMLRRFSTKGLGRFAIATQVQNVAVQRIWAEQGLVLQRAETTVHVNALLGRRADRADGVRVAASRA